MYEFIGAFTIIGLIPLIVALVIVYRFGQEAIQEEGVNESTLKKTRRIVRYLAIIFGLFLGVPFGYPPDINASLARKFYGVLIGALFCGGLLIVSVEIFISAVRNEIKGLKKKSER